jgi:hypothetical protein
MAGNKTKTTGKSVADFLKGLKDPEQRRDSQALVKLMRVVTKQKPRMWGTSMVGFGEHHYQYASGREGDIFILGFAPRKPNLVIYSMAGGRYAPDLMAKLGRYKTGKGCLYIRRLEDIHLPTLKKLLVRAFKRVKQPKA